MTQRINKWINESIYEFYLSVSNPIWILFSLSHLWSFIYGNEYFQNLQSQKLETTWSYSPINGWLPGKSRSLKEINDEYGILPGAFFLLEAISNPKGTCNNGKKKMEQHRCFEVVCAGNSTNLVLAKHRICICTVGETVWTDRCVWNLHHESVLN